jgi:hypothetical protein
VHRRERIEGEHPPFLGCGGVTEHRLRAAVEQCPDDSRLPDQRAGEGGIDPGQHPSPALGFEVGGNHAGPEIQQPQLIGGEQPVLIADQLVPDERPSRLQRAGQARTVVLDHGHDGRTPSPPSDTPS